MRLLLDLAGDKAATKFLGTHAADDFVDCNKQSEPVYPFKPTYSSVSQHATANRATGQVEHRRSAQQCCY